ncbi:MAG: thiol:disulfide interchange protein DsbA/DsbL [Gammaproteobacteria bacterium]|nr:thiol:disulfide interchange protein DsbA/DsbL [Gammaproteobacteria bacterium]
MVNTPNRSSISVVWLLIASAAALWSIAYADQSEVEFDEGFHYHRISPALPVQAAAGQVEVLELFWYGCPHCYVFEKHLSNWETGKADHVKFTRMPAVMNRNWMPHARAYYALEQLGEVERLHSLFFDAIHDQGRRLRNLQSISRFLGHHGVDTDSFEKAYNSSAVTEKIEHARQLARNAGANSVPTIIINGKYRSTASDAGGHALLLQLIDSLVIQEINSSRSED